MNLFGWHIQYKGYVGQGTGRFYCPDILSEIILKVSFKIRKRWKLCLAKTAGEKIKTGKY